MLTLIMQAAAEEAAAGAAAGPGAAPELYDEGLLVHMLPFLVIGVTVIIGTHLYR